jgi:hypothetical protein
MTSGNPDDEMTPYTLEERQELRKMLRDSGVVKDMFNQQREIFTRGLNNVKEISRLAPDPSVMLDSLLNFKGSSDLNDTIEALALNEIQLRELIRQTIDAIITDDKNKLKEIRKQIEK